MARRASTAALPSRIARLSLFFVGTTIMPEPSLDRT
jgi:hypothetical protein